MAPDLHRWSAVRLLRGLASGELHAATLAEALIEQSVEHDPRLHAWAWFDQAHVRGAARAVEEAASLGPLHGLPIAVKDAIDTAGIPTAYGSPIYAGHVPAQDAAAVALARAAGAWVFAKSVTTEFANTTPAATLHPLDGAHTPGGSSSGSAVAVAAGLVPLALGTQTAGSVIRPAAYCGVVGYKPSPRRIPRAGVKLNSDTLDEVGVIARSVDDAALLGLVLAGDAARAPEPQQPRIGVTLTSRADAASASMQAMVLESGQRLSATGAAVHDVSWPARFDALFEAQRVVQLFETVRALAPERLYRREQLSPGLTDLLDEGARIDGAAYAAAREVGRDARARLDAIYANCDLLIAPAAPGAAPRDRTTTGDPLFSRPWQLLGCACITLPAGRDAERMPLGLQLIARPGDDVRLFAAAAWIEAQLDPALY